MKHHGMIFNGEMVRAILDGSKTQTRRMVKPQPEFCGGDGEHADPSKWGWHTMDRRKPPFLPVLETAPIRVGDIIWVRETWAECIGRVNPPANDTGIRYRASDEGADVDKWRPSIHMPRWASRIDLEVTAVRVERVQDIEGMNAASSDALKEGVHRIHHEGGNYYYSAFRNHPDPNNWTDPFLAFKELWNSIYANWDSNPFVWVYEFRRVK